jgi:hypothetical protein
MRVVDHPVREEFLGEAPSAGDRNGILFLGRIEARKGILMRFEVSRVSQTIRGI